MEKVLALFDFDGTISRKDTFFDFLYHYSGKKRFVMKAIRLIPVMFGYQLKLLSKKSAKERVFRRFFKGVEEEHFREKAHKYSLERLKKIVKESALERINWHKSQNHDIVIVTGSVDYWLVKWCEEQDIKLIATSLEVVDGKITGKLSTENCYGAEKVNRIKEQHDLESYDYIYAYGNSRGDREMFDIAHEFHYKNFK